MKKLFRPEWTCGRFIKTETKSYALFYNLMEGMAYFFEEESAEIIGEILKYPKNSYILFERFSEVTNNQLSNEEIIEFCNELISVGILTVGQLTNETISNNREIIGLNRKKITTEVVKTVKERLPFHQSDAENTFSEILEKLRIPSTVMFELTYNCNEQCVHCFNPGAARNENEKSERNNRKEIDINDYESLLDELYKLGVVKIILTGGDPFVKKDIWKLIKLIYEKDFALDIYTNGLALTGKVEQLAKYYPRSVGLSVYSSIDEIHESITRIKGSLKYTLKVAGELSEFGIPLYFKCPIMKHNATSYFTIVELAKSFGAITQIDVSLTDSVDGDTSINEQLQIGGDILEIILRDPNIPLYVGKEAPNYGKQERDNNQPFCGAGSSMMNITPEGDVTPCNSLPLKLGNLRHKTFKEIINFSKQLIDWQQTVINDYVECGKLEICDYCSRCPGQSFIEHFSVLKASTANCKIATARMNLAKNLIKGNDPLKGKTIEENLKLYEYDIQDVVSKKVILK